MASTLRNAITATVFGNGLQGELADRGLDWLEAEGRRALGNEHETITRVHLAPGETYTVIARPRATRAERKLARQSKGLNDAERRMGTPTRRQLRAARRLARAQRRRDSRTPGSRRWAKAAACEAQCGTRFDKVMAPSKRLARTRAELAEVNERLDTSRAASLDRARSNRGHRRERTTVYD